MAQWEKFEYPLMIKEGHLDTFGHVNNATYLSLLEEARWEFIQKNGFGLEKILETGVGPTILEIKIEFKKELRNRQNVTIVSQVLEYKNKIAKLDQKILNDSGEVAAKALLVFGLFDTNERKLVEPSTDWLRAVGAL